jgi:hypothetical protein
VLCAGCGSTAKTRHPWWDGRHLKFILVNQPARLITLNHQNEAALGLKKADDVPHALDVLAGFASEPEDGAEVRQTW